MNNCSDETNSDEVYRTLDHAYHLFYSSRRHEAIKIVRKVVQSGAKSEYAHYLLGEFFTELREFEKAKEHFNAGMRLNCRSPECRQGLSYLYLEGLGEAGNKSKALELLQGAARHPGVSIRLGVMRLNGIGGDSHLELAKFNFLKAYAMGNLIGYRLLSHVFWKEKKFCRAIGIEISAFFKILPIYIRDRHDVRIWAPWLDWSK